MHVVGWQKTTRMRFLHKKHNCTLSFKDWEILEKLNCHQVQPCNTVFQRSRINLLHPVKQQNIQHSCVCWEILLLKQWPRSFFNIAAELFFLRQKGKHIIWWDLKMQRDGVCTRWINRCDVYTAFKTRKECLCPDPGHSSPQGSGTQACWKYH